jgi:hypothetical protein
MEGIDLNRDEIAVVLDGARQIPENVRDDFFAYVAGVVRSIPDRSEEDVRRAVEDGIRRHS